METPILFTVCRFAQKISLKLFADWKVTGRENVPPMGPLIVVANHQANIDPAMIAVSLPRRPWFLAKDDVFGGPFANWFLRSYGAFPLDRSGVDMSAFRWVLRKLAQDQVVVLFSEGTRSGGALQRANPGIVQIAIKSGAPLLPVGLIGTERLGAWTRVFNPTGKLEVNIGTVFSLPPIEGRPSREALQSLADMIMQRVAALLPEGYRGVYSLKKTGAPP